MSVRAHEERIGIADVLGQQIDLARGLHDRIHDVGIGDEHILQVDRQFDQHRLVDADRDLAGNRKARIGRQDHVRAVIGFAHRRPLAARGLRNRLRGANAEHAGQRHRGQQHSPRGAAALRYPHENYPAPCRQPGTPTPDSWPPTHDECDNENATTQLACAAAGGNRQMRGRRRGPCPQAINRLRTPFAHAGTHAGPRAEGRPESQNRYAAAGVPGGGSAMRPAKAVRNGAADALRAAGRRLPSARHPQLGDLAAD